MLLTGLGDAITLPRTSKDFPKILEHSQNLDPGRIPTLIPVPPHAQIAVRMIVSVLALLLLQRGR